MKKIKPITTSIKKQPIFIVLFFVILMGIFVYKKFTPKQATINYIGGGIGEPVPTVIPTANPFASLTCQVLHYKIPISLEPQKIPSNFNWSTYFVLANQSKVTTELVNGGEYYAFFPSLNNTTGSYLSTFDSFMFRARPFSNGEFDSNIIGHGLYYGYMNNTTSLVHLGKIELGPKNNLSYSKAFLVYYIHPNLSPQDFGYSFEVVNPGMDTSNSTKCGTITFKRGVSLNPTPTPTPTPKPSTPPTPTPTSTPMPVRTSTPTPISTYPPKP